MHAATEVPKGRAGGSRNKRELKQSWSCQFLVKWSRGRNTPASLCHPSPESAARPPCITETDSEQRGREPKSRQCRAGLDGPSRTRGQQGHSTSPRMNPAAPQEPVRPQRWQSDSKNHWFFKKPTDVSHMPASHSSGSSAVIHGASRSSRCPCTHKALQQECYYRICSMTAPSQPSGEETFGKSTYSHRQQAQTTESTLEESQQKQWGRISPL